MRTYVLGVMVLVGFTTITAAAVTTTTTTGDFSCYQQYASWKIQHTPTHTVYLDTKVQCVKDCAGNQSCVALHYNTGTKLCHQYNARRILGISKMNVSVDDYVVYERNVQWLHVFGTAVYSLDFTEAQEACKELGGRLMTYSELHSLFLAGEEYCSCAWIDGGSKNYIMQQSHGNCGSTIGIVDCSGWGRGQAWCTVNA